MQACRIKNAEICFTQNLKRKELKRKFGVSMSRRFLHSTDSRKLQMNASDDERQVTDSHHICI